MANVPTTEARVLVPSKTEEDRYLPEGPREVDIDGRAALVWVNIQAGPDTKHGAIHLRFWDTGETKVLPQPSRPGFLVPTDRPGVIFVGREKEVGLLDLRDGGWTHLASIPDASPRTIINDGEGVPGGRAVVFGTKDLKFADPIAHLYLFTLDDRRIWTLADKQTCSNGKVFVREGGGLVLYDIDTPRHHVMRYRLDVASHTARPEGVAVDLHSVEGSPDGMRNAGDGTAVIAIYNGHRGGSGRALHYDLRSGKLLNEWATPGSPRVTCPLLLQRDGGVKLVLTTAVEGMPAEQRRESPNAGDLFIADTGLRQAPLARLSPG